MSSWTAELAEDECVVTQKRLQNFVFTINNYGPEHIKACEELECTYIIYAKEAGALKETPHIQGYVETRNGYTLRAIRKHFHEKIWVAKRRGTAEQASDYCKKGGDFVERGTMKPGQGKRTDLHTMVALIEDGVSDRDLVFELQSVQSINAIQKVRSMLIKPRDPELEVIIHWFWGPTGLGKTETARREATAKYKDYDEISFCRDFAEGYTGVNDAVIFDDIRARDIHLAKLLRLLQKGKKEKINIKNGDILWNAKEVWVTSPTHPYDFVKQYNEINKTHEDPEQLVRRCTEIRAFEKKTPQGNLREVAKGNIRPLRPSGPEFTSD